MKKLLLPTVALLVSLGFLLLVAKFYYLYTDSKYFRLFSKQPTMEMVEQSFGEPIYRHSNLASMSYEGWELPKIMPKETDEVWIYGSRTGRRFYLFFGEVIGSKKARVLGFYSSSS